MMELLSGFSALSLISGAALALLPEGSLRKTASMAVGLMMLMYWAEGVTGLLRAADGLDPPEAPSAVLTETGLDLTGMENAILSAWEESP